MIFVCYVCCITHLPECSFPDGAPPPNHWALAFLDFTIPVGTSRQASIRTYEGQLALLQSQMSLAWLQA